MISRIADYLSRRLTRTMEYDETSVLWVAYSLEVIISTAITFGIIVAGAVLLNKLRLALLYFLFLIPIREYTGGYHAKTHFQCISLTSGLFFISLMLAGVIGEVGLYAIIAEFVSGLCIIAMFCPVKNENKSLDEKKKRVYKIIALLIFALENLALFIINGFNGDYGCFCFVVILFVLFFILFEIAREAVKLRKQKA